jgi:ABC-type multidrug transport system fused ATPase/permease subunit
VLALVGTCVPAVVLSNLQKDETYRSRTKWMKEGRLTLHYSDMTRTGDARKEIRFLGLYPYIKEKWHAVSGAWMEKKKRVTRKHVLFNSASDLLRNGVYLAVVVIAAFEIFRRGGGVASSSPGPGPGLGTFMLVISAAAQLQGITTTLLINAVSIFSDVKYMEDFFGLLGTETETPAEAASKEISANAPPSYKIAAPSEAAADMNIEFNNVCFSYPDTDFPALNHLSVAIRQGEKIAVVGANGSGKSTFVNLLCGLYFPQHGRVLINGIPISECLWETRRSLSVIFQYFCQYQDTLRSNITVSDPARAYADTEILRLARQTGADEVIKNKRMTENADASAALDEEIGIFSESGNNLSGGEWQKVAITRALFRQNARVYILDEPTAALDPMAEANIYRNFAALTGDKTAILISHRLGVTHVVDRILVFDKGKIVEDGSHDLLMEKDGLYARMYRAQAKWYQ